MRDVAGAYAQLEPSFWSSYHTFGLVGDGGAVVQARVGSAHTMRRRPAAGVSADGRCHPCLSPPPPQHWAPGQHLRWFIDGNFVYEINSEALKEYSNGSEWAGTRRVGAGHGGLRHRQRQRPGVGGSLWAPGPPSAPAARRRLPPTAPARPHQHTALAPCHPPLPQRTPCRPA